MPESDSLIAPSHTRAGRWRGIDAKRLARIAEELQADEAAGLIGEHEVEGSAFGIVDRITSGKRR